MEIKIHVIMNWLECKELHFVQTLTDAEKKSKLSAGSLYILKTNLNHNKTILLLESGKLSRDKTESAEEWMDYLRVKVNECNYKGHDRQLKISFSMENMMK